MFYAHTHARMHALLVHEYHNRGARGVMKSYVS